MRIDPLVALLLVHSSIFTPPAVNAFRGLHSVDMSPLTVLAVNICLCYAANQAIMTATLHPCLVD